MMFVQRCFVRGDSKESGVVRTTRHEVSALYHVGATSYESGSTQAYGSIRQHITYVVGVRREAVLVYAAYWYSRLMRHHPLVN